MTERDQPSFSGWSNVVAICLSVATLLSCSQALAAKPNPAAASTPLARHAPAQTKGALDEPAKAPPPKPAGATPDQQPPEAPTAETSEPAGRLAPKSGSRSPDESAGASSANLSQGATKPPPMSERPPNVPKEQQPAEPSSWPLILVAIMATGALALAAFAVVMFRRGAKRLEDLKSRLEEAEQRAREVSGETSVDISKLSENINGISTRLASAEQAWTNLKATINKSARAASAAPERPQIWQSALADERPVRQPLQRDRVNRSPSVTRELPETPLPQTPPELFARTDRAQSHPSAIRPLTLSMPQPDRPDLERSPNVLPPASQVAPEQRLAELLVAVQDAADSVLADGVASNSELLTKHIVGRLTDASIQRIMTSVSLRVSAHNSSAGLMPDFSNPDFLSITKSDGQGWLVPNPRATYAHQFVKFYDGHAGSWPRFAKAATCSLDSSGKATIDVKGQL